MRCSLLRYSLMLSTTVAVASEPGALELQSVLNYSRSRGGIALLVDRNGERLLTDYAPFSGPNADHRIFSITKNLWAFAAMAAVEEGWLDLDERAAQALPEWRGTAKERITLRQLLSMTSGVHPSTAQIYGSDVHYARAAIGSPLRLRPGSGFDYGAASMEAFGEVLRRKLKQRRQSPENFLAASVLKPNGIRLAKVKRDDAGNPMFSSGARATAPDLLQLGRAVMRAARDGRKGEFFKGTSSNPAYGLTFWLNRNADSWFSIEPDLEEALDKWPPGARPWRRVCLARAAPRDMIALVGSQGQRVYVVPSMELVIVRLGAGSNFVDAEFWRALAP